MGVVLGAVVAGLLWRYGGYGLLVKRHKLSPSVGGVHHTSLRGWLRALAETGRLALRRAVVAVHADATGAEQPTGNPGNIAVAQAAQWVANRWALVAFTVSRCPGLVDCCVLCRLCRGKLRFMLVC